MSGFTDAIAAIRSHEEGHMNAGVSAATADDLYEDWDAIVSNRRSDAKSAASKAANTAYERVSTAIGTHTGATLTYNFWTFTSGSWSMGGVHLQN